MKIEHIAIWTKDIERLRKFYTKYFDAKNEQKYTNDQNNFSSYFLTFDSGCRLEIMAMPDIPVSLNSPYDQFTGIIHLAISVGSKDRVDELTTLFHNDGYHVLHGPRVTGDGYYESSVLDPDGNRLELTI